MAPEPEVKNREARPPRESRPDNRGRPDARGPEHRGPRDDRRGDRGEDRRGGRPEGPLEIDIDKLIADSLYLDNQAHGIVSRMRDMDSGTRSQLRRL